jgi:hypothetical protein
LLVGVRRVCHGRVSFHEFVFRALTYGHTRPRGGMRGRGSAGFWAVRRLVSLGSPYSVCFDVGEGVCVCFGVTG